MVEVQSPKPSSLLGADQVRLSPLSQLGEIGHVPLSDQRHIA
jgi:hypothetical protein